ncbi:hypothetical protein NLX86_29625 [Streptomyces sp. A3M-1-3]|uniref:hypothetical protein n=1 Tax=Streptomyces sp. A3M-1-3 TaxID=2962044 RepID=UPI0020B7280B|nr:hypothetical protein [Streptomyces sp. A3M-1-3]MCP3822098.1 hypothetical protein [Streptomyces sp. A3M-1-3]
MYGGEVAIRLFLEAVAFADNREHAWGEELQTLRTRHASLSTGVRGAFQQLWGDGSEGAVASVYADIAHRHRWLRLDRSLSQAEYDEMRHTSTTWCNEDRYLSEIIAIFGPPSMLLGGSNPNYPKTLAYTTDRPEDALLCFHLWNGSAPGSPLIADPVHAEPVLLAIRHDGGQFNAGFTFTPAGSARRELAT